MSDSPRHPLRDVLASDGFPLDWLTGVVTAKQVATAPYRVQIRLADGTVTDWLSYLGWWEPTVNDVVHVLRKGPALLVIGPEAPANVHVTGVPVTPDTPPAPPPAAPALVTVPVAPVDRAYWGFGTWRREVLIQGGPTGLRTHWFYGTGIAAAKGAGTIVAGVVYVERENSSHGVNGAANVRLGVHGLADASAADGSALGAVSVQATLQRGQAANVPLSAAQIAALNAGSVGLGLEPGSTSYSSPDYLKAVNAGASGQLSLTVQT